MHKVYFALMVGFGSLMHIICATAATTTTVVDIPSDGATQRILYVRPDLPKANLVVVPGGDGILSIQNDGSMPTRTGACGPTIRTRAALAEQGIALALVDANSLGSTYGPNDIRAVIRYMQSQNNVPVWITGGSASTSVVSTLATSPSSDFRGGVVFFSPQRPGSAVARITRPTFVISHAEDPTAFGSLMFNALTSATIKERMVLTGGNNGGCGVHLFEGLDAEFAAAVSTFINKYNPTLATPLSRGVIDIDGDGKHEILVRSSDGRLQSASLVNNALQFSATPDPGVGNRIVGVGDFNGDGRADLAFQNMTQGTFGDVKMWSGFSNTSEINWRQVKQVWDVEALGDLDGDGFADLVWRYVVTESPDTGVSYIWFTNGNAVTQVRKRGGAPLDWKLLGALDINGDGAADMIYLNPQGQLRALMATPSRTCANLSAGTLPAGFSVLKFADFSGTGRGDLLLRDAAGAVQLFSLDATGLTLPTYTGAPDDQNASCTGSSLTVASSTLVLPTTDPSWQFYASGDLNGDGQTDIVWKQPNGALTVWLLAASGAAPLVIQNAGTAPTGFTAFQNGGPKLQ